MRNVHMRGISLAVFTGSEKGGGGETGTLFIILIYRFITYN